MLSKVTRYYYDLAELANLAGPGPITGGPYTVNGLLYAISPIWSVGAHQGYEQTMFENYFWPQFYEAPVLYIDKECAPWEEPVEPTATEIAAAVKPLVGRIHAWYADSLERFGKLITLYNGIATKLMDQVQSVTDGDSKHAESDTPQSAMTDMFAAGYASRTNQEKSKVTVKSDVSTPIDRLREVQEKLRCFYADWAGEFDKFVLHEAE